MKNQKHALISGLIFFYFKSIFIILLCILIIYYFLYLVKYQISPNLNYNNKKDIVKKQK
jgi:uncharacterized membrane protein